MNHFIVLTTLSEFDHYYSKKPNRNDIDSLLLIDAEKEVTFLTNKKDINNDKRFYTKINNDPLIFKMFNNYSSKIPVNSEIFEKIKKTKLSHIHRMDSISFSQRFSLQEYFI